MSTAPSSDSRVQSNTPHVPALDLSDSGDDIIEFRGKTISPESAATSLGLENVNGAFVAFREQQQRLNKEMPFVSFLALAKEFPELVADAHKRLYAALHVDGTAGTVEIGKESYPIYNFLKDPDGGGVDAMFGGNQAVHALASQLQINDKRVFVVYGPTGTGKNTLMRRLKAAFEKFSKTPDGAVMELGFKDPDSDKVTWSNRRENPLHAIPRELRSELLPWMTKERPAASRNGSSGKEDSAEIAYTPLEGDLSFESRAALDKILKHESVKGDFIEAMKHLRVRRFTVSEADRRGVAAFVPRTIETNQVKANGESGSAIIPTAQGSKEEGQANQESVDAGSIYTRYVRANRGMLEFQEIQRLSSAVRGTLLTSAEDHVIESPSGDLEHFDLVILGHTTKDEYEKMIQDPTVRRRVIGIPLGYNTRVDDEREIYQRDFHPGSERVIKHMAPLALDVLAQYAVLTRLGEPKSSNLTLIQKMNLYNGDRLPGVTNDDIAALRSEHLGEGMSGDSPADSQNRISALLGDNLLRYVSPYDVLREIERETAGTDKAERATSLVTLLRAEVDRDTVKHVKESWHLDDVKLKTEYDRFIDEIKAYTQNETREQKFTGQSRGPDERFLREVEEQLDIPESRKDKFRSGVMSDLAALSLDGKIEPGKSSFEPMMEKRKDVRTALAKKLGLSSSVANIGELLTRVREQVVGPGVENSRPELQESYDRLIANLQRKFGYNQESAEGIVIRIAKRDDVNFDD